MIRLVPTQRLVFLHHMHCEATNANRYATTNRFQQSDLIARTFEPREELAETVAFRAGGDAAFHQKLS